MDNPYGGNKKWMDWERHPSPQSKQFDAPLRDWRTAVLKRDNHTCQSCGSTVFEKLEAHHIYPVATHPQHKMKVRNGITLCHECHVASHAFHNVMNKLKAV
jgi:5-methylcytosine-specific restriction endonuclease McrA